jgi:DNA-binding NarL/FixJ family response regulator
MPVKVLVVDDDESFRWLFRTILRFAPDVGPVIEAEDGVAALDLMRSEHPQVVVMDVMMPRLDGIQTARFIKQEWPETKVVVVTSVADEAYQRTAYASGADAFLNKRHISTSLIPIIRDLMGSGAPGRSEGTKPGSGPDDVSPGLCQSPPT